MVVKEKSIYRVYECTLDWHIIDWCVDCKHKGVQKCQKIMEMTHSSVTGV